MRTPDEHTEAAAVAEADEADTRSPGQIEADIVRRRERLAETLDEIAVRVHPKTIAEDTKAKVVEGVDQTLGRVYEGAGRVVLGVKRQFVTEEGAPRLSRVVPAALLVVGVVGLLTFGSQRRGGRRG
ncbi:DUF3618 domain-containing protein [Streptomyces odontomachi]|uniref:DUF3618 domain-containing protein n=1 Tax=Streptomyces odontomachi TaxID=2944940 RepID=UPI00210B1350|nr:DUF3618 domain-containing protein [Streptomyces sp. ODS25]